MREHTPKEASLAIKVELVNHSSQEFGTWNKKGSMCGHWKFLSTLLLLSLAVLNRFFLLIG